MAMAGLELEVASFIAVAQKTRERRDATMAQKQYRSAIAQLTKALTKAIGHSEENPELAIIIARQCTRFVMEAMPDPAQDPGRATSLSQFKTLENLLSDVRRPGEYLASMKEQFGPNLDPRNYKAGLDAFSSIIKSQRQRLYAEGQGFNNQDEKNFCRKRSELLAAVEKSYNRLRNVALGIEPKEPLRSRSR